MNVKSLIATLILSVSFATFSQYQNHENISNNHSYNSSDLSVKIAKQFQENLFGNENSEYDSSRDLPSIVTFDIDGLEDCDYISVTGSWDGWSGFGATTDNDMTLELPAGYHEFKILCVDTSDLGWQNNIWGNAYTYYAPIESECWNGYSFDSNYTLNVDGSGEPITISYCAGTCEETCDESSNLPSIVTFDLEGLENCDFVHITGTFDGWSAWGVHNGSYNFSRVISNGDHQFRILCVDASNPEWYLDVYGNSFGFYPPINGDCSVVDDYFWWANYTLTVDGSGDPITVSYYAGTCNDECDFIFDDCGECNGDNTSCIDECDTINGYGVNENGWQVATNEEGYILGCYFGGVYEENIDWAYGEYTTLEDCALQCESNPNCTSFEFSEYFEVCAFWFNDACNLVNEEYPPQLFQGQFIGGAPWATYIYTGECDCEGNILDEFGVCVCVAGDVNNDNSIDVLDVVSIVNFILMTQSPTDNQACASDYNQDGNIDVLDVVQLVNIILN